jgi:hypothetical protein
MALRAWSPQASTQNSHCTDGDLVRCPLLVKSRHLQRKTACPLIADMCSATRYVRFVPIADIAALFDHLVGTRE